MKRYLFSEILLCELTIENRARLVISERAEGWYMTVFAEHSLGLIKQAMVNHKTRALIDSAVKLIPWATQYQR
jgi:hypothetical protein